MNATALLSILSGAVSGFALGLVGGGGSVIGTPLLIYVVGIVQPHVAIGTGSVALSVAALFNLWTHTSAGNVRWRSALVFAVVGVAGALIGATIGKAVDGQKLFLLFALLMVVVGGLMLRTRDDAASALEYAERSDLVVAGLALLAGTVSGFFGIGGGFLIVPCLLYATRMKTIHAIGSSLLAVAAFSIATAATYAVSGLVDWTIASWFVLGGIVGGTAGTLLAVRLAKQKDLLRHMLGALILIVAACVVVHSLSGLLSS